jgi:hypothetical protein
MNIRAKSWADIFTVVEKRDKIDNKVITFRIRSSEHCALVAICGRQT